MLLGVGVALLLLAAAMIVAGAVVPEARVGLLGGGIGVGLAGLLLAYLDFPSRGKKRGRKAKARVLSLERQPAQIANYPIVKLDLEVRPKGGSAYQVSRKFTAGKFQKLRVGDEISVLLTDPTDPEKIELA